jgi:hypothetical protein
MSHEDKSVTPVTTDPTVVIISCGPHHPALRCSSVCDLDCKLNRTGHSRLKERGFFRRAWSRSAIKARKHKDLRKLP